MSPDLVAPLVRHFAFPAYVRWKGTGLLRLAREYERTQRLPEEEHRRRQLRAAQELLRFAWERNAFYRARLRREGIAPGDVRTLEDWARLPLLTKDDLREHADALVSQGLEPSRMLRKRTGGSTGVPVHLHWDPAAEVAKGALRLRHDAWAGFVTGARRAALWGDVKPRTTVKDRLWHALFVRTVYLDTLEMDEGRMLAFVDEVRRTRARLLFGHGHSLYFLARFLQERGIRDLALDGIISSAEMLPPEERRVVEEVFGRIVFDRYGCEEVGLVASECERHDGLHVAAEGLLVEILGGGEAEPGRVVVTDLLNRGTPLLRYEIGDLATTKRGPCGCGRGLPRIGKVVGRTSDVLYAPGGRRVSGISLLDTVTIHIPGFRRVQVVQEAIDLLVFHVVKDPRFDEGSLARLAEAVERTFGPAMRHRVVFVDAPALTGRGKFQFSICRLRPEEVP